MLGRDTEWRQGHLLTRESATALCLVAIGDRGRRVIVVTHDCDLAHGGDQEQFVEVIVGALVRNPDGNLSYAKNPRRLHLKFTGSGGASVILELRHVERTKIHREKFDQYAVRDGSVTLSGEDKRTLKQWLAARYGRPAFPNAFETRLRKCANRLTVEQRIAKILEPEAEYLVGLFFDLAEQRREDLGDGRPYTLSISVVYDAIEGGPEARKAAERVATNLRRLFNAAFGTPDVATEIALDACEAVADTNITLADLRRIDQWRLEHISLRDESHGDFLPAGGTPA